MTPLSGPELCAANEQLISVGLDSELLYRAPPNTDDRLRAKVQFNMAGLDPVLYKAPPNAAAPPLNEQPRIIGLDATL